MNRRLIASTLGASLLAPGAAALADPMISPGITFIGMGGDGPMSGFSAGAELTVNHITDGRLFDGVHYGGLLQFELDFDGNFRLSAGGQAFGPFVGAELAWTVRFGDAPTANGVMLNPFFGLGYVNVAWRNLFDVDGYTPGAVVSLKVPVGDYGQILPSGRPLRDAHGAAHKPRVVVLGRRPLPAPAADLPMASRVALGRAWLEDARDEHAAVDAFRKLARQLAARGAPRALVRRALRSARDEARHARDCLNIAEALLGLRLALISPPVPDGPLPNLPTMAVESRLDGALAEGAAARVAALGARRATVAPAQRLQAAIAREEAGHAELGRAIERWAVEAGGAPVRAALEKAAPADPDAVDVGAVAPHGDEALWRRWGRASASERRDAWAAV